LPHFSSARYFRQSAAFEKRSWNSNNDRLLNLCSIVLGIISPNLLHLAILAIFTKCLSQKITLERIVEEMKASIAPLYDFKAADGVMHRFWALTEDGVINKIVETFEKMPATYVADGHHRTAAAALVGREMAENNPGHTGNEEYNYFMAVHFPADQLNIIGYNRVVRDLNGLKPTEFIDRLRNDFNILEKGSTAYQPEKPHEFGMYLEKKWYELTAKPHAFDENNIIRRLDVTILSQSVLTPVLHIKDLRTDDRIDFVGGIRGLKALEQRVDSGEMKLAFSLFPVSMHQLMDIADNGMIMPPKTTWFEPKLRSGLVVHVFD
jgi:uncharacterized protein (DUF1015 family)